MAQIKLHDQRKPLELWKLIGRCTVSCISVLLSQLALSLVPCFFSASPLFIQLILSGPLSLSLSLSLSFTYMCIWSWLVLKLLGGFCGFVALVLLVVVGLGRCSKRLLGVSGSASAFVFFSILFLWAVYLAVLRPGAFFFFLILSRILLFMLWWVLTSV